MHWNGFAVPLKRQVIGVGKKREGIDLWEERQVVDRGEKRSVIELGRNLPDLSSSEGFCDFSFSRHSALNPEFDFGAVLTGIFQSFSQVFPVRLSCFNRFSTSCHCQINKAILFVFSWLFVAIFETESEILVIVITY
jgi:hypothetical protein